MKDSLAVTELSAESAPRPPFLPAGGVTVHGWRDGGRTPTVIGAVIKGTQGGRVHQGQINDSRDRIQSRADSQTRVLV